MDKAKVYFTKDISPESLQKVYDALNVKLTGKIGVKVSTGERGAKGYLKASLIGPFVKNLMALLSNVIPRTVVHATPLKSIWKSLENTASPTLPM